MLVKYNKTNPYRIMGYIFMPGINKVDEKKFAQMAKHPHFKFRLDKGIVEVVDAESKEGKGAHDDKTPKEMEAFIAQIMKPELLEQIRGEDKRPAVHKAIDAQLEKIRATDAEKAKKGTKIDTSVKKGNDSEK